MKNKSFIKKIEKRIPGVKIHKSGGRHNDQYWFQHGDRVCSWYVNQEGHTHIHHSRQIDDHHDWHTDYHAGYYLDNATQLLNSVAPPAPKFGEGDLVRCKDNKRMNRWGLVGELALVIDARTMKLQSMSGKNLHHMSERDLELAS